jgi:hypothetical protein
MPNENQQQSGTLYQHSEPETVQQYQPVEPGPVSERQEQPPLEAPKKLPEEKTLLSWTAPTRPFQPRSRDFYVKIISMAILFGVVLFIIDGIMPVLLIIALLFLFYVLSTVKPENIEYKITNIGIYVADKRTDWDRLGRFWFVNRMGADLLAIEAANIAGRMEIMVPDDQREKVEEVIGKYLVHEQIPPTFFDKAAQWASNRLPLE